jgi:hypothetical protein
VRKAHSGIFSSLNFKSEKLNKRVPNRLLYRG